MDAESFLQLYSGYRLVHGLYFQRNKTVAMLTIGAVLGCTVVSGKLCKTPDQETAFSSYRCFNKAPLYAVTINSFAPTNESSPTVKMYLST